MPDFTSNEEFFNVWKMSLSRVGKDLKVARRFFVLFFMVHYGGFCAAHLLVACAALGHPSARDRLLDASVLARYLSVGMFAALGLLLFEHGRSFYVGVKSVPRERCHLSDNNPCPRAAFMNNRCISTMPAGNRERPKRSPMSRTASTPVQSQIHLSRRADTGASAVTSRFLRRLCERAWRAMRYARTVPDDAPAPCSIAAGRCCACRMRARSNFARRSKR